MSPVLLRPGVAFYLDQVPSRRSWPKGLRLVVWANFLGFAVHGLLILFNLIQVSSGQYPMESFGIFECVHGLLLGAVVAALLARRKTFSILALLASSLSGAVCLWRNLAMLQMALPNILSQPFSPKTYFDLASWYFIGNSLQLGINTLIIFYICYYELRRARSSSEIP